jgi:hypothetical protein
MQKYSPMFAYVRKGSLEAREMFRRRPGSRRWNGEVAEEFRRELRALPNPLEIKVACTKHPIGL